MTCGLGTARITEQRKTAPPTWKFSTSFERTGSTLRSDLTRPSKRRRHFCKPSTASEAHSQVSLMHALASGNTFLLPPCTDNSWCSERNKTNLGKMALFLHRTCHTGGPALVSGISIFAVGLLDYRKYGVINSWFHFYHAKERNSASPTMSWLLSFSV